MRCLVLPGCLSDGTSVTAEPNDRVSWWGISYQDMKRSSKSHLLGETGEEVGHCEGGGRNADEAWRRVPRMAALLGPGMGVVLPFPLLGPLFSFALIS